MVDELDEGSFQKALADPSMIIVDFWAPWCGPCRQLAPAFEQLSTHYKGKLRFAKVNVDENQSLAGPYSITAIPCLIVFKNGKEFQRIVGSMSAEMLKKKIDEIFR